MGERESTEEKGVRVKRLRVKEVMNKGQERNNEDKEER